MADKTSLLTSKKSLLYGDTPIVARQAQASSDQKTGVDRLNALLFTGNPIDYGQSQAGKTVHNRLRTLWKNR